MSDTPNLETAVSAAIENSSAAEDNKAAPSENNAAGQETAPPAEAAKQTAAEKKRINKLKLKVYGKEVEEELPFDFEENPQVVDYLTKNLQMSKAASRAQQDKSQLEKEVAQFLKDLKENPRRVLTDPNISVDVKKLAKEIIEEEISNAQKSPEQLAKEKLEAELKRVKEDNEKQKKDYEQRELERLQQQEYERYDILMTQALDTSQLPKTPYVVKKMADYMLLGLQNGIDVTPSDVIPLVKEEMQNDLKAMFGAMPDEVIENIVGKDVINRIRKRKVAAVKEGAPTLPNNKVLDTGKKELDSQNANKNNKKLSYKDFFGV